MGKKKSSKTETTASPALSDEEMAPVPAKQSKKAQKAKRKEDEVDDIARELEEMTVENNKGGPKTNGVKNSNAKKTSKSKKEESEDEEDTESEEEEEIVAPAKSKFGGFAALMDDDMCADMDDDEDEEDSPESEAEEPPPPPPPKQTKNKKEKKNAKKVDTDDWDDLDDLITPPPEPAADSKKKPNKKDKKKAKKNKQEEEDEEDLDKLLQEMKEMDGVKEEEKTPEESASVETVPAEESKPKAKRKNKNNGQQQQSSEPPSSDVTETTVETTVETASKESSPESEAKPIETDGVPNEEQAQQEEPTKKAKKKKRDKVTAEEKQKKKEEEEQKKEEEEEKKKAKKGLPNKKILAAMKEAQQKQREEEEKRKQQEDELRKQEEERIRQEEERKRLEEERKEKKKQKEKERKERLRAEGKLLTAKQRADQRRAQEMLEHLKAQGVSIPEGGDKKGPRLGSKAFAKKKTSKQEEKAKSEEPEETGPDATLAAKEQQEEKEEKEEDGVKDSWDMSSEDEEEPEEESSKSNSQQQEASDQSQATSAENSEDDDEEEDEVDNTMSMREKIIARIKRRKERHENNRDINVLRAPVVCVLGHVDHGKTKILDKLRRTNVQEGEVGGITQQIGATNVPSHAIAHQTKMVKDFSVDSLNFPGLLIIDTPGHESFSNLRNRGSSLCDIAILVVDITQGLEPQTLESIELLKKKSVPFIVALNKVDRIFEWDSNQHKDIKEVWNGQKDTAKNDFDRRTKEIMLKLTEQGLNVSLFWENEDPRKIVSLVPTSAITGDGMGNLIAIICDMCQARLAPQLRFSGELQCIVLEVKTIQGHGTTIDVILINGVLKEGDTIVLAGTDGAIETQIRSLLLPKPMKEIRVKGAYDEFKEVKAAQGIKIAAKELEKAIAGLQLRVAQNDDEVELLKEAVEKEFSQTMRSIKVSEKGVYVQASTLGALEALLEFFKSKKIPYSGIRVGPVVKKDVMKAAAMLEHDDKYAVILAFDVRVERDAQELADKEHVRIFSEETIYHLGDRYVEFLEEHKRKKQEEHRAVAVFPCKLKIIPEAIFNKRDPIVLGVTVEAGVLRTGTLLCVPLKEFVEIGVVSSMEFDHKSVDIAKKGVDVCIKIDPAQGTTPKLFGRHFEATDEIVSKISRESINACKDFFRDDLTKTDWKLMSELKKLFSIL